MIYLIDTHYVLWSLFEPEKISKKVKGIFEDQESEIMVSGISLWEISLKYSLGKLDLVGTNPDEIQTKILESGFDFANVENSHFASYYKLPKKEDHKDPFDRMLIWQAIENDYIFVSNDGKIEQYVENGLKVVLA